jgi:hypothetical protein
MEHADETRMMPAPASADRMLTPRRIFYVLLAVTFVWGLEEGWELQRGRTSPGWTVALTMLFSFLSFLWYRLDSDLQRYRRSLGLNVAILAVAFLAYPYYIVRSRPRGRRLRAFATFCGGVLLLALASGIGSVLWDVLG